MDEEDLRYVFHFGGVKSGKVDMAYVKEEARVRPFGFHVWPSQHSVVPDEVGWPRVGSGLPFPGMHWIGVSPRVTQFVQKSIIHPTHNALNTGEMSLLLKTLRLSTDDNHLCGTEFSGEMSELRNVSDNSVLDAG